MTFGQDESSATIVGADGTERAVPHGPKSALAEAVWDAVVARLPAAGG